MNCIHYAGTGTAVIPCAICRELERLRAFRDEVRRAHDDLDFCEQVVVAVGAALARLDSEEGRER